MAIGRNSESKQKAMNDLLENYLIHAWSEKDINNAQEMDEISLLRKLKDSDFLVVKHSKPIEEYGRLQG
jgi:hypothetical protein